jgi:beta-glucosidase
MFQIAGISQWKCVVLVGIVFVGLLPTTVRSDTDVEGRINALISQMTLQEKLGQMSQTGFPAALSDKWKEEIRAGRWGSLYNGGTAEEKAEAQRIALTESRLHIPLIYAHDVIHGYRTTYPIPLGESATWNPELIQRAAHLTAIEASREGIHWTFSPMMDICRDARWGRIAETLGEDPYLSGVMASALVRGLQGDSLLAPDSIAACGKHYVGYGAAEAGRDYNTTWIPEVLLRNVYLVPFHAAEQAGAASFMSAFNDLNGVPASGNEFTLRQVMRNEWGFDGLMVSDYQAVTEMIPHGYASDDADAACKSIQAGVDMEMVSTSYYDHGAELIASGRLDPKFIDESVRNILRLKFRLGLFDGKATVTPAAPAAPDAQTLDIAKQIAEQGLVLLKDDNGALPLAHSVGKVAVIGPLADSPVDQVGSWAVGGGEQYVQTPLATLRKTLGEDHILYSPGLKTSRDESHDGFAAAVDAANGADVVLLFLGEEAALSGEAASRSNLNLPGAQEELVNEIAKSGKPMIAIIMAGRPLTFDSVAAKMDAVLWAFHPGTMGGPAIVDTLFGDSVPSGKLTVTFPRTVGQCPIYYDHMNTGRPAWVDGPASKDKYTSKYVDVSFTPEYPFGYGLSYAHFQYTNLHLSSDQMKMGGDLQISADVTNTGSVKADEIVQLYTRQMVGSLTRPVRELRSFQRIHLDPGQTQTVQFQLKSDDLAFYNAQGTLAAEPGEFHVWIAPDSASGLMGRFTLAK